MYITFQYKVFALKCAYYSVTFYAIYLILELVNQFLHPFMIFVIFFLLESQILDTSIETPLILLSIHKPTLFLVKLAFQFTKSLFKTLYNLSTSFHRQLL